MWTDSTSYNNLYTEYNLTCITNEWTHYILNTLWWRYQSTQCQKLCIHGVLWVRVMVFNATFNNISVISWQGFICGTKFHCNINELFFFDVFMNYSAKKLFCRKPSSIIWNLYCTIFNQSVINMCWIQMQMDRLIPWYNIHVWMLYHSLSSCQMSIILFLLWNTYTIDLTHEIT